MNDRTRSLIDIVDDITEAGESEEDIEVGEILDSVGRRSFGPMLLVPGLLVLSPLSGIPGVPTIGAVIVLLISAQVLVGHRHIWIPKFVLGRRISRKRMARVRSFLAPTARVVDIIIRPRLVRLTRWPFHHIIAGACALIAVAMPPLETIPFANVVTAAALSAFGLGLTTDDGLLILLAFALTTASLYFIWLFVF